MPESETKAVHPGTVVTGKGPGPRWVCPGTVRNVWVLDFV